MINLEGHVWIHVENYRNREDRNGILEIEEKDLIEQLLKQGYDFVVTHRPKE